ncbi:MAG: amino acid ABC transporter permease, partial [Ardenticatenales bacterium]|nr:amino acid ABC transporter permease [Ardenticatenales bacterium]
MAAPGLWQWLRANLFNTWYNTLISLLLLWLIGRGLVGVAAWAVGAEGWRAVAANMRLFFVGTYPAELLWRVEVAVWVIVLLLGLSGGLWKGTLQFVAASLAVLLVLLVPLALLLPPTEAAPDNLDAFSIPPLLFLGGGAALMLGGLALGRSIPYRFRWLLLAAWILSIPLIFMGLIRGMGESGRWEAIPTNLWGGFLVTMTLTVVGILGSFPLGVLLALGRRSTLPVVRLFSTLYIEVIRGVPLVTVFFMSQLMLPLFLPENVRVDSLLRAMVGVTLFSAAYLAENVRGGLQSIPRGQTEAAQALGLSTFHTTMLITLPQALRAVIPALVGQFISLFKDTSLVAVVGIFDLLGVAQFVIKQPAWLGTPGGVWRETFVFIALIYFIISFTMSRVSLRI